MDLITTYENGMRSYKMELVMWGALGLAGAAFAMASQQGEKIKKLEARIKELEDKF